MENNNYATASNDLRKRTLEGFIKGKVNIVAATDVIDDLSAWNILIKNNYALLRVDLQTPMSKGETRLLRFRIKPRATGRTKHAFFKRWLKILFTDDLYYSYEIFGPFNVQYRILSTLKSYTNQIEYSREKELGAIMTDLILSKNFEKATHDTFFADSLDELAGVTNEIITILQKHAENPQFTNVIDWRINILPGKFKALENIREYGAAKICGVNRNLIKEDKGERYLIPNTEEQEGRIVYQWKAGKINTCPIAQPLTYICQSDIEAKQYCKNNFNEMMDCYPSAGNFTIGFDCNRTFMPWVFFGYILFVYEACHMLGWLFETAQHKLFPH